MFKYKEKLSKDSSINSRDSLMQTLLQYAFETLKVKSLYARAFNTNTKAISLYLAYGFNFFKKDCLMSYFVKSAGEGGL